jgi:site-specific DNA recombinase
MNTALYARVSTEKQADKELSIPAQLQAMREYARQRDWSIVEEFLEPGASARTTDRPVLKKLLARCADTPKIDVVLVHKVDRLARDVYGHATIKALFKRRGIRLASVVENVDDTITGHLVENIMASIAEFYSANLGEEVKKGQRVMVQRGGWPHQVPRGYRLARTPEDRSVVVPDESIGRTIADMFELYATGRFSLKDLGQELLLRGVATASGKAVPASCIRDMLENPFYTGRMRWKGAEYPARHPGIVSEELFRRVQSVLRHRFKEPGERGRTRYLLRGLASCGDCGHRMTAERHKQWHYYRCVANARGECSAPFTRVDDAHHALLGLYARLNMPNTLSQMIRSAVEVEWRDRQKRFTRGAEGLRRQRDRHLAQEVKLTEAFVGGQVSPESYRALCGKLREAISNIDAALAQGRDPKWDIREGVDKLLGVAASLRDVHLALDLVRQQQLLVLVFSRLTLDRGAIADFELKPPFNVMLRTDVGGGKPAGVSPPQFEQRSFKPAIKSLFEFDFTAFEQIIIPH